jgi:hypothetical protein
LRQAEEILGRTGRIAEYDTASVLESAGGEGCFEEKSFCVWIVLDTIRRGVVWGPWVHKQ